MDNHLYMDNHISVTIFQLFFFEVFHCKTRLSFNKFAFDTVKFLDGEISRYIY